MANDRLGKLVAQYQTLLATQKSRELTPDETQQLDLLQDVILEANSALDADVAHKPRRTVRADYVVDVTFNTSADAAASYSRTRDLGAGGLSLATPRPLPKGTRLELQLRVPGWAVPVVAAGVVAWSRAGAMGIAFEQLAPADAKRLRSLVAANSSMLQRLRSAVAAREVTPVTARLSVSAQPVVLVRLGNADLAEAVLEVLELRRYRPALELPTDQAANLVLADTDHAIAALARQPNVPLVLVNASGPEALLGSRLAQLRPSGFVRRPATPDGILQAVLRACPSAR